MARGIYKFFVNCGRAGSLDGTFAAEAEDIAFAVGKTVHFEEPWGKHSGVMVTFEAAYFTLVSIDPAEVATFDKLDLAHGDCPLGLLNDSISDGRVELADEEAVRAPTYYKAAVAKRPGRLEFLPTPGATS